MSKHLERMWKETILASEHLFDMTEKRYLGQPVQRPRFENGNL